MKQAPARLPAFAAAGSKLADTRSTVSPADRGRVSEADREHSSRHCEERKQSILFARPDGLLRFARNDGIAIATYGRHHNIPDSSSSAFSISSSLTITVRRGTRKTMVEAQAIEITKIALVSGSVVVEWPPR
jgi:hypothetical protein